MGEGVLYIATGDGFIEEAKRSLTTLRDSMDVSASIITHEERDVDGFDSVIPLPNAEFGFRDKVRGVQKSPYERTVLLDTDTYIWEDFTELFTILDRFDIGATYNQNRDLRSGNPYNLPGAFPEYSTGVMPFKKSAVEELFETWLQLYNDEHLGDQQSFRKAVYESDVRLATLPRRYNYFPREPGHVVKEIKIFHGRLLDIESPGAIKHVDLEDLVGQMNQDMGHRLFAHQGYYVGPEISIVQKIDRSIKRNGLIGTLKSATQRILKR